LLLFSSVIQIDEAVAHFVPQFVVRAHRYTIELSVNSAIRLPELLQPLLVRHHKSPEPVQEFQVFVDRIRARQNEEPINPAVPDGKGTRVQMMPKLRGPNLPVALPM
jgi:hypothetical protein